MLGKKWVKKVSLCLVVILGFLMPVLNAWALEGGQVSVLQGMKSYKIYYHAPNEEILTQLGNYDFVIIEPYHYSVEQIRRIKAGGTLVFGYISVMEAANWNQTLMDRLEPQDFFYRGGQKIHFAEWDSYLMDITSIHYQEILKQEIETQIIAKEFDGVFLDTVGDIDDQHQGYPAALQEQRAGLKLFLQDLTKQHPTLPLIQNWGFETLKTTTAPYVSAIMWESFHYPTVAKDQWSLDRIKELKEIREKNRVEVLTVSFSAEKKSRKYAVEQGFIHFHAQHGYDAW